MKAFLWEGFHCRYIGLIEQDRLVSLEVLPNVVGPLVGDIYMGRVTQAIPSQEVFFVDIGEEQLAYLQGRDVAKPIEASRRLKVGDWTLIQIKHEAHGNKGPKVTDKLSLQGKWTVLLTGESKIMASQKIRDSQWRQETLKTIAEGDWINALGKIHLMCDDYRNIGLILRTEAQLVSQENLYGEIAQLMQVLSGWGWQQLSHKKGLSPMRCYRPKELWRERLETWLKQGSVLYTNSKEEAALYQETGATVIRSSDQLYNLGISQLIKSLLKRHHEISSGGSLAVDELEALTAIDVNSASFQGVFSGVGESQLALNLAVLPELCRLIDLRDLSGMLLVDFVNMQPSDQKTLINALSVVIKSSGLTDIDIKGFTRLGILEMTRKRSGKSLLQLLGSRTIIDGEMLMTHTFLWDQVLLEIDSNRWTGDGFSVHIWEGVYEHFLACKHGMRQWLMSRGEHLPEIYVQKCGLTRLLVRLEFLDEGSLSRVTASSNSSHEVLRWI